MVRMQSSAASTRAGITLMEVLISIGILSVGLASVVALIPAGGSLAKKTIVEDRRGSMGAAAIADVFNYGMLNPAAWSAGTPPYRVVIDPIGNGSFPTATGLTPVNVSNIPAGSAVANLVFSAADDLVYVDNPSASDPTSDPPIPKLTSDSARRLTEGGYSWLATLVPSGFATPPQFYTLSVVEFFRRPPAGAGLTLSPSGSFGGTSSITLDGLNLDIDEFRSVFPQGGAVLFTNGSTIHAWRRIQLASPVYTGSTVTGANIALDRDTPAGVTALYALEGTVGVVERGVQLEGPSPWLR